MKEYSVLILFLFVLVTSLCQAQTPNPTLWGMTHSGGTGDSGIVFNYNIATGSDTDLHNFNGSIEGAYPYGSLIQVNDSLLYGMTSQGGTYNFGTIFRYNITTHVYTDLYNFSGDTDGQTPYGSLLLVDDSMLYGMTAYGGYNEDGIIFSFSISTGAETVLHSFGNDTDGEYPYGSLIKASNGLLYGMTELGGGYDGGIIFSFNDTTNTETVLHDFNPFVVTDGYAPTGSLIQARTGLLYGLTSAGGIKTNTNGGTNNSGVIFNYNISTGTETAAYDFGVGTDGRYPFGSLIQANNGLFYGMTFEGGTKDSGIIFSYNDSTGTETDLHDFGARTDGFYPQGSLIQLGNGLFYGMTYAGGTNNKGTIFNFSIPTGIETDIHDFTGADGVHPFGDLLGIDTATIYIIPLIAAICEGSNVILTAIGASNYTWSPATGLSATTGDSVTANPTATVTYTLTGTKGGRTYTTTIIVTVNPNPTITVDTLLLPICSGTSATLTASGAITYTWAPATGLNATTGDNVIATPATTTTYYVRGTGAFDCTSTDSEVVNVLLSPNKPTFRQHGDTLISSSQYENHWYRNDSLLNDTGQYLIITSMGEYRVNVTNEANGCSTSSDSLTIDTVMGINQLSAGNNQLLIYPNPSPGKFILKLQNNQNGYTMEICNVMGEKIYQSVLSNAQNTIDFTTQPAGMYFIYFKSDEGIEIGKVLVTK